METLVGMLRVALAMAVVLSHLPLATFKFISGGLAVQGFFIVSGFYMALVLDGKYRDTGLFYSNRALRLFPSYFVMMAIAAVCLFGLNASATAPPGLFATLYANPVSALILGFQNLTLIGQDLLYWFKVDEAGALVFDTTGITANDPRPIAFQALLVPQSWSLSLELIFYALAPFLARLSTRWIVVLAAASIGLRFAGYLLPVDFGLWQGRFFPTIFFLFLLGMLAYRAMPLAERAPAWLGYAACAAILALVAFLPMLKPPREIAPWLVYAAITLATPLVFRAFRGHAWDRWIGDLSYPIYLSHLVVIGLVLTFNPPYALWVALGGTLALSAALLVFIDMPVDRWRQSRLRAGAGSTKTEAVQPA
jgi:peptidoglycan/LPS O-acetylase OafA/YrhL